MTISFSRRTVPSNKCYY